MNLNGNWKLYFYPFGEKEISDPQQLDAQQISCIDALVPGNVELDLSRAGLLPYKTKPHWL